MISITANPVEISPIAGTTIITALSIPQFVVVDESQKYRVGNIPNIAGS